MPYDADTAIQVGINRGNQHWPRQRRFSGASAPGATLPTTGGFTSAKKQLVVTK
jgi:hypothetical protein